jgi:rhamnosyltransferase
MVMGLNAICGVVVTYNPSSDIASRLERIAALVDTLVVVDNSADPDVAQKLQCILQGRKSELIANTKNLGIATAMNLGAAAARRLGSNYVVFFDQDSNPDANFRTEMELCWVAYRDAPPLAILGCNLFLADNTAACFSERAKSARPYVPTDHVITSGSLYDIKIFERIGYFCDEYFIDCVDIEYCWRARRAGFAVCRTTKPLMKHNLGNPVWKKILGHRFSSTNHSAVRQYFIVRNSILLMKAYCFTLPRDTLAVAARLAKMLIKVVMVESGVLYKLKMISLGAIHGIANKTDCNLLQNPLSDNKKAI